jgi:hypothetical protein
VIFDFDLIIAFCFLIYSTWKITKQQTTNKNNNKNTDGYFRIRRGTDECAVESMAESLEIVPLHQ